MYFSAQLSPPSPFSVSVFSLLPPFLPRITPSPSDLSSVTGDTPQNLCDKPNYGAVGKPWDHDSKPGAWCGGSKPSNSGQWAQLVTSFLSPGDNKLTSSLFGMVEILSSASLSSLDTA